MDQAQGFLVGLVWEVGSRFRPACLRAHFLSYSGTKGQFFQQQKKDRRYLEDDNIGRASCSAKSPTHCFSLLVSEVGSMGIDRGKEATNQDGFPASQTQGGGGYSGSPLKYSRQ